MKRQHLLLCVFVLILGALISCGVWMNQRAAAPMAQRQGQVTASLTALPENLSGAMLTASGGNPVVCLEDGGTGALYEVMSNAYRRVELPLEGAVDPELITPAPDGGLWMVMRQTDGLVLAKTNLQGTSLVQQEIAAEQVQSIICDSVGHVFLAVNGDRIQRYAPTGEFQGSVELDYSHAAVRLAAQKERVFARIQPAGKQGCYIEILPELEFREAFDGCLRRDDVWPIGSFLPEYTLMEHDAVGLYACRDDGCWETVALWKDLHLGGHIRGKLLSDSRGCGILLYEDNGETYVLSLAPVKS